MGELFDSQGLGRRVNELLILGQLRRAPLHGYRIALEIAERSGGYFPFNYGTLYPILHRLESAGLIAGEWSDPEKGRARKLYALTEAGRTYLDELSASWNALNEKIDPFLNVNSRASDEQVRSGTA